MLVEATHFVLLQILLSGIVGSTEMFRFIPVLYPGSAWEPMFNRTLVLESSDGGRFKCAGICLASPTCRSFVNAGSDCHLGDPDFQSSFLAPQTQSANVYIHEGKKNKDRIYP